MKTTIFKSISYSFLGLFLGLVAVFSLFVGINSASASDMVILSVTNKTDTSATVSAKVTNIQNDTTVRGAFEYATNPSLVSSKNTTESLYNLSSATTFSQTITGLTPNTTYYVRALGLGNADGVAKPSGVLAFTTLPATAITSPTTTILTAKSDGPVSVKVSMHYNLGSVTTGSAWFEYGTTSGSYPNKTSTVSVSSSNSSYTETIFGLSPNTTYYVRSVIKTTVATDYSNSSLIVRTDSTTSTPPTGNVGYNPIVYIYGCMRSTDANYNSKANYHIESMCASFSSTNGGPTWGYPTSSSSGKNVGYLPINSNSGVGNVGYVPIDTGSGNYNSYNYGNTGYTYGSSGSYGSNGSPIEASASGSDVNSTNGSSSKTETTQNRTLLQRILGIGKVNEELANEKNSKDGKDILVDEEQYDANQYLASAFWGIGNGFFPTTLIGWLILIVLIFGLIVLTRYYFSKNPIVLKQKVITPVKPVYAPPMTSYSAQQQSQIQNTEMKKNENFNADELGNTSETVTIEEEFYSEISKN